MTKIILFENEYAIMKGDEIVWTGDWNSLPISVEDYVKSFVEKDGEFEIDEEQPALCEEDSGLCERAISLVNGIEYTTMDGSKLHNTGYNQSVYGWFGNFETKCIVYKTQLGELFYVPSNHK